MPRPTKAAAKKAAATAERVPVTIKLPRALVAKIDALAEREERPRTKIIELGMRKYVEDAATQ